MFAIVDSDWLLYQNTMSFRHLRAIICAGINCAPLLGTRDSFFLSFVDSFCSRCDPYSLTENHENPTRKIQNQITATAIIIIIIIIDDGEKHRTHASYNIAE